MGGDGIWEKSGGCADIPVKSSRRHFSFYICALVGTFYARVVLVNMECLGIPVKTVGCESLPAP